MSLSARRARTEDAAFIERLFSLPHVEQFLNAPSRDEILAALDHANCRAFEELECHCMFLEVREDNGAMRGLAERFGFVQEGVYRDGFQNVRTGEFKNLCPYGMLEHEYRYGETHESRGPLS